MYVCAYVISTFGEPGQHQHLSQIFVTKNTSSDILKFKTHQRGCPRDVQTECFSNTLFHHWYNRAARRRTRARQATRSFTFSSPRSSRRPLRLLCYVALNVLSVVVLVCGQSRDCRVCRRAQNIKDPRWHHHAFLVIQDGSQDGRL